MAEREYADVSESFVWEADASLEDADMVRAAHWDFPGMTAKEFVDERLGAADVGEAARVPAAEWLRFKRLPVYRAMPEALRLEVEALLQSLNDQRPVD